MELTSFCSRTARAFEPRIELAEFARESGDRRREAGSVEVKPNGDAKAGGTEAKANGDVKAGDVEVKDGKVKVPGLPPIQTGQ